MSDETDTTGEAARVLGEHYPDQTSYDAGDLHGCMGCGWEVPRPRSNDTDDWEAYWAHQAAMLAEAGLLREDAGLDDRVPVFEEPKRRLRECVENWPDAETGEHNPSCCRFPKSCSASVYDPECVTEDDLEQRP